MNVRLTPRVPPGRTLMFGGIANVRSDGVWIWLRFVRPEEESPTIPLASIREIAIDDEPGDAWE